MQFNTEDSCLVINYKANWIGCDELCIYCRKNALRLLTLKMARIGMVPTGLSIKQHNTGNMADFLGSILDQLEKPPSIGSEERKKAKGTVA